MLEFRTLILLIEITLVVEYILVLMPIYEIIDFFAFELTLINELFLALLLLVEFLLEKYVISQVVLLKLIKNSIDSILVIFFVLLELLSLMAHVFHFFFETFVQLVLVKSIHCTLVCICRIDLRIKSGGKFRIS
jgi:hypothetical protein